MFKKIVLPTLISAFLVAPAVMAADDENKATGDATGQPGEQQGQSGSTGSMEGQGQQAGSQPSFKELDRNSDGQLDEQEISQMDQGSQEQGKDMLEKHDENDDGKISEAEFRKSGMQDEEVAE